MSDDDAPVCSDGLSPGTYVPAGPAYTITADVFSRTPVWFDNAATFPAGRYRVGYVRGAFRYGTRFGWGVDTRFSVCRDGPVDVGQAPGLLNPGLPPNPAVPDARQYGYASQAAAEAANAAAAPLDFDHPGGPLGVRFFDSPYYDNISGHPAPTWRLQRLQACVAAPPALPGAAARCDVPTFPALPDEDFIADCAVPAAPDPIPDCPAGELSIPPPQVRVPCPVVTVLPGGVTVVPGSQGSVTATVTLDDAAVDACGDTRCGLGFQFNVEIPAEGLSVTIPCPRLQASATAGLLPPGEMPEVTVEVTQTGGTGTEEDPCLFDLQFGFQIPPGPQGPQGRRGPQGPQGRRGPQGPQGPHGPTGPYGPEGPVGPCPTLDASADITCTVDHCHVSVAVDNNPDCTKHLTFAFQVPMGPEGPTGPAGADGSPGSPGATGPAGAAGATGAAGPQGPHGYQGAHGAQGITGSKLAIVPDGGGGYVGLSCLEGPEVWFLDLPRVTLAEGAWSSEARVSRRFAAVCEPGSVRAVAACCDVPEVVGAVVEDDGGGVVDGAGPVLVVRRGSAAQGLPRAVVSVVLAGVRKGMAGRFPRYTAAAAEFNNRFWQQAVPNGQA